MSAPTDLLHRFYTAFQQRDAATMAACYHPDARFSDPVFGALTHDETVAMWTMLCKRGKDLQLNFEILDTDDTTGRARWEARYTYSATGRAVTNRITSAFVFKDGLILQHDDTFDFWRWTRMALGLPGILLGWTPMLRNTVRQRARKALGAFMP